MVTISPHPSHTFVQLTNAILQCQCSILESGRDNKFADVSLARKDGHQIEAYKEILADQVHSSGTCSKGTDRFFLCNFGTASVTEVARI